MSTNLTPTARRIDAPNPGATVRHTYELIADVGAMRQFTRYAIAECGPYPTGEEGLLGAIQRVGDLASS
jgi:hypothetical protein